VILSGWSTLTNECERGTDLRRIPLRKLFVLVLIVASLMVSGCATIVRGTTQSVSINSEPTGAKVTISSGQSCMTPCNIEAERKNTLQITVTHEGCNAFTTAMVPSLAGAGAMLGGFIDYGTGAVYDLQPNPLFVTLNCNNQDTSEVELLKAELNKRNNDEKDLEIEGLKKEIDELRGEAPKAQPNN